MAEKTRSLLVKMQDGTQKRYPNHASFVLIGADPPIRWLAPLKFKADARKAGTPLPFIPADHAVRWWGDLMKAAGPAPPPTAASLLTAAFLRLRSWVGFS